MSPSHHEQVAFVLFREKIVSFPCVLPVYTLRTLLTDCVTMVTNITCDKRIFIMTHYSNTPTPSFIFNDLLKTIFNQGAVFSALLVECGDTVLFSMSNTHESRLKCLKKDLMREYFARTPHGLQVGEPLLCHAAPTQRLMLPCGQTVGTVVPQCAAVVFFVRDSGRTLLFILFTFVSHQLRCLGVCMSRFWGQIRGCVLWLSWSRRMSTTKSSHFL